MTTWTRDFVAPLMLEAGRIAYRHYDSPAQQIKPDGTVVTAADQEIEAFFCRTFDRPEVGLYLLGEETVDTRTAAYLEDGHAARMAIVDPIDGTAPYSCHIPIWGVSVGFAEAGVLTQGAVYLPVTGELFISEGDAVYLAIIQPDAAVPLTWRRLPPPDVQMTSTSLIALTQDMAKYGVVDLPTNPVHCLACAVVPLTYLLLGRYVGYFSYLKLWDLAGALPMLHKLGLEGYFYDGMQLSPRIDEDGYILSPEDPRQWKLHEPVLFCLPANAPTLLAIVNKPDSSARH